MTGLKRWIVLLMVGLAAFLVSMQGLASGIRFLENQASSALGALGDVGTPSWAASRR